MRKGVLSFIFSLIFSVLLGMFLWFIGEVLSYSDILMQTSLGAFILDIGNLMMFIVVPIGTPFGCIMGTFFVDRIILKQSTYTIKRLLVNFILVFSGMVFLIFVRVFAESYDIPRSYYFLRGDMFIFTMPVIAAMLSSLTYCIRNK